MTLYFWKLPSDCFVHMEINRLKCKYGKNKSALGEGKALQSLKAESRCSCKGLNPFSESSFRPKWNPTRDRCRTVCWRVGTSMCVSMLTEAPGSNALELKLQTVVSLPMWVLRTKLGSFAGAASVLDQRALPAAPSSGFLRAQAQILPLSGVQSS